MRKKEHKKTNLLVIAYCSVVLIIVFFIVYLLLYSRSVESDRYELQNIRFIGTYETISEGATYTGKAEDIHDFKDIDNNEVVFRGNFDKDIGENINIMLYIYRVNVDIYQNSNLIFSYRSDIHNKGIRIDRIGWEVISSPGIYTSDDIEIHISSNTGNLSNYACELLMDNLCSGNLRVLLHKQLSDNRLKIIMCFIIFSLGLSLIVACLSLKLMNVGISESYVTCGFILICGAVCTLIDYSYIDLLFGRTYEINLFDTFIQLLICFFITVYIKQLIYNKRSSYIVRCTIFLWIGAIIAYYAIQINADKQLYKIDTLMYVLSFLIILFDTSLMLAEKIKSKCKEDHVITVSIIILILISGIEVVHYIVTDIFLIYIFQSGLAFFTVMQLYSLMLTARDKLNEAKMAQRLERELVQNQITIMLSQIQPHFLYNTIAGIKELCYIDANEAGDALQYFARFLRRNMDSISASEPISFNQELEHVKNYVYLQKLRFGDELTVEFDIEEDDFLIPTLTLQPIVENAIKYGVENSEEGGTVRIHTWRNNSKCFIEVCDDGEGYVVSDKTEDKDNDSVSHVGLDNCISRIKAQCAGTLVISGRKPKGTRVLITIPIEGHEN